ncbi:MAG: DNA polymerase III subunit delta' [Clostridia bacterium]
MNINEIVGNEKIKETLYKAVMSNTVLHSYLFTGIEGIGKKMMARAFAQMILCENEKIKPCQICKPCLEFENGNHPDFMQIEAEDRTIKIEQIRYMQEKIAEKPIVSSKKVYIIEDSDTMTKEAQNCLLKTLEEPPKYAIIILIATNESKLLNTIKSRCIKIPFQKIEDEDILKYMKERQNKDLTLEEVSLCEGSIAKAIGWEEKKELYTKVQNFVQTIDKMDLIDLWQKTEFLYKSKEEIFTVLEYMISILYHSKEIRKLNCIAYVEDTKKRLLANSNYDMCLDNLLMKMWEEINEKYSRG